MNNNNKDIFMGKLLDIKILLRSIQAAVDHSEGEVRLAYTEVKSGISMTNSLDYLMGCQKALLVSLKNDVASYENILGELPTIGKKHIENFIGDE